MDYNDIKSLYAKRQATWERSEELLKLHGEGDWPSTVQEEWDTLKRQLADYDAQIDRAEAQRDPNEIGVDTRWVKDAPHASMTVRDLNRPTYSRRALARRENFTDLPGCTPPDNYAKSLGTYMRAAALGTWNDVPESFRPHNQQIRAQSGGDNSAGGYLVPDPLSSVVQDLVRARLAASQLGVTTIPFDEGADFSIPTLESDATPGWIGENAVVPESDLTFGYRQLESKTLAVMVRASRQVVDDSAVNFGELVAGTVSEVMAREVDRVVFDGNGAAEPEGIKNTTGITTVAGIGSPVWSDLSSAYSGIRSTNYEVSGLGIHPRDYHTLFDQVGSDGHYVDPPRTVADVPMVQSTVFGGSDASKWAVTGDLSKFVLGVRQQFIVLPLTERYAENLQVAWIVFGRFATAAIRPAALTVLDGVTA